MDYIRGLTEGEGTFTFSTNTSKKRRVPAFCIKMHARDKKLLELVRDSLGLKNKVYEYEQSRSDGVKRSRQVFLIIRDIGSIKNVIVPLFYKNLIGNKGKQFEDWIRRIGNDPWIPERFKFIYKLYKSGFYERKK